MSWTKTKNGYGNKLTIKKGSYTLRSFRIENKAFDFKTLEQGEKYELKGEFK